MPVSDQWKAREKGVGGQVELNSTSKSGQGEVQSSSQTGGQGSSTTEEAGALSPGRTKGLAGFWANQNDEVKVSRKKRLEAVETPSTETVVENVPQRLEGVVRAEDPGEWQKREEMEAGRTRSVASAFQQQQNMSASKTQARGDVSADNVPVTRRVKPSLSDTAPAKKPAQSPEVVLNRSSATVILAENDPQQLDADVVRSSGGSSWDDVTELEAGRTRNLLQHWKSAEEDAAQPKTSTTRYQGGAKPAWILEIEEARATSTGAIGQSEAWAGNSQQQQQQQLEQLEQLEQLKVEETEKKDEAEEKAAEEVSSSVEAAVVESEQSTAGAALLPEPLSDEPVTSQQPPVSAVSDVFSPHSHTVHDLCDVSVVTVTRDPHYETPSASVVGDQPSTSISTAVHNDDRASSAADITASHLAAAEDFEICEKNEMATDNVIAYQKRIGLTEDEDIRGTVSEPRQHEQPLAATSSSPSSSTATATVARQQTTQPSTTTSTAVDLADQGRSKKRPKDDKSKMNEQSAEHRHHRRWCSIM